MNCVVSDAKKIYFNYFVRLDCKYLLYLITLGSEIIDDKAELKLEVWSHSTLGSDKMIGECNVGMPSIFPREHILDSWFDLKVKPGKKVLVSVLQYVYYFLNELRRKTQCFFDFFWKVRKTNY